MARRRELPDELDPRVREFVVQLREVVDRDGLGVTELAERTGYGRTSWERYLDGRMLAPKGAVVALAEITGTPVLQLTTMWELAERAWSRSTGVTPTPPRPDSAAGRGSRRWALFLGGVMAVVMVVVGAFLLTDGGDAGQAGRAATAVTPSSPSAGPRSAPPSGVGCEGVTCTGKDAEAMGCSGDLVTTTDSATVGTVLVEVRYSRTCGAAWGRITRAASGDEVRVTVGRAQRTGTVTVPGDTIAYTPMIAVTDARRATACVVLASGERGCTG
ncbi:MULTISPECIES: helix-turn-helix domain-containing protein [Streptomyces]|uniref:DUF2690 domain-containing protein n=2 Tax=Streptomyces TaxID=1883 RepID=A0ABV9II08_9ACTN